MTEPWWITIIKVLIVINIALNVIFNVVGLVSTDTLSKYSATGNAVLLVIFMLFAVWAWWYGEDRDRRSEREHAGPRRPGDDGAHARDRERAVDGHAEVVGGIAPAVRPGASGKKVAIIPTFFPTASAPDFAGGDRGRAAGRRGRCRSRTGSRSFP